MDKNSQIFVLRGYAGTGKTSLIGGFIKKLHSDWKTIVQNKSFDGTQSNPPYRILASTGRAAKILSDKTIAKANTVHSMIYRMTGLDESSEDIIAATAEQLREKSGQLRLNFEPIVSLSTETNIYIVDEASMIADEKNHSTSSNAVFGEGDLLGDLLKYDSKGKFIFVGDPCQLPPIFQRKSPALDAQHLRTKYQKSITESSLNKIYRQDENNDILKCATNIREIWENGKKNGYANPYGCIFPVLGYNSISTVFDQSDFLTSYIKTVKEKGYEYATLICNSNKECNLLGNIVRQKIHNTDKIIIENDLLLVTQNNYLSNLVNGDIVVVRKIEQNSEEYHSGLTFVNVEVEELANKRKYTLLLIEDLLSSGEPNLTTDRHALLMRDFCLLMKSKGIYYTKNPKTSEQKKMNEAFLLEMKKDRYLNALRANYGYALTCHKSQGGEWDEVFLFLGKSLFAKHKEIGLFQWLYTAVTRAKNHIYTFAEQTFNLKPSSF
jgi:ATP-dependent exoDNAse (exonuclease V) alpha subunit